MILDENERPLVPVHECWDDAEAEIVVGVLRDYGIEARANSEVPHSVLPVTADGLAKIQVLVNEQDATRAREVIDEHRKAGEEWNPAP